MLHLFTWLSLRHYTSRPLHAVVCQFYHCFSQLIWSQFQGFTSTNACSPVIHTTSKPYYTCPNQKMGIGGFVEPAIVVTLLFGGTWVNRNKKIDDVERWSEKDSEDRSDVSPSRLESSPLARHSHDSHNSPLMSPSFQHDLDRGWGRREVGVLGLKRSIRAPNTQVFHDRILSRLLLRFPFLVEVWYWALIYWVNVTKTPAKARMMLTLYRCISLDGHSAQ